jgi:hypothetical protein
LDTKKWTFTVSRVEVVAASKKTQILTDTRDSIPIPIANSILMKSDPNKSDQSRAGLISAPDFHERLKRLLSTGRYLNNHQSKAIKRRDIMKRIALGVLAGLIIFSLTVQPAVSASPGRWWP